MNNHLKVPVNDILNLHGKMWPITNPQANVIIITGMEEHSSRYDDFAAFLNNAGFSVHCLDYFGQGENALSKEQNLGEVPVDAFNLYTNTLGKYFKSIKRDLPLYVLGHSMGSFLCQELAQKYSNDIDKLVIVGSNGPDPLLKIGFVLARLTVTKRSWFKTSKFLASMAVGAYGKAIKNAKTPVDWLSYNEENVQKYIKDSLSGIPSSKGFYKELLRGTSRLYNKKNVLRVRQDLPIYIIAGKEDPVGKNGKGVVKLFNMYKNLGFNNVYLNLYEHMRHEILNETDKAIVYQDILVFLK